MKLDKKLQMRQLIDEMSQDRAVEEIWTKRKGVEVNLGLVNQFRLHKRIPNKWFDWERSADAEIMILGQDWGPYSALKNFISDFDESRFSDDQYYQNFLFKAFTSRTEKFILKAVEGSYYKQFGKDFPKEKWNEILFTMAVLFTRQGEHFRGSHNFDQSKSFELSYKYLVRQLEIIQPKVIVSLGGLAFEALDRYFSLGYKGKKISEVVNELDGKYFIKADSTIILPNFHPAAHIDPKIALKIWDQMWRYSEA